jgi:hypothetical protein
LFGWNDVTNGLKLAAYVALEAVSIPVYATYYVSYEVLHGVNQWGRDHGPIGEGVAATFDATIGLGLLGGEAIGLGGDIGLDWVKNKVLHNGESCRDEGIVGPILGKVSERGGLIRSKPTFRELTQAERWIGNGDRGFPERCFPTQSHWAGSGGWPWAADSVIGDADDRRGEGG